MTTKSSTTAYLVIPRRRTPQGMAEVPADYLATEFAVFRETTTRNKSCTSVHRQRKLLSVHKTRKDAEADCLSRRRAYSAPGKRTIGQRFGTLQRPAIYGSTLAPMHKKES